MHHKDLKIKLPRLMDKIQKLGQIGALPGGGVCRLALTDEDKEARDLLQQWMKQLDLEVKIDELGNMFGIRSGKSSGPLVMVGSHLDTVGTGGLYDGSLGVLAGLEIVETLNEAGITTARPFAVANFTNEEGVRFTPDMMGSHAYSHTAELENMLNAKAVDGSNVSIRTELERIGYNGQLPCGDLELAAFLELHIEQGPVLEAEEIHIGAVEMVQGIYWTEYIFKGVSNHAGTTPMPLRKDAGYAAASTAQFVREQVLKTGGNQVGTVGLIELSPNLINVVAQEARVIVDLRNTDEGALIQTQTALDAYVQRISKQENLSYQKQELVRFPPVQFDKSIVSKIEERARALNYSVKRMPSGAGHDAQMMARLCPTAMIFVPSVGGISHNIKEFTKEKDLERGCNVLLQTAMDLLNLG